jgi:hypothetical protein
LGHTNNYDNNNILLAIFGIKKLFLLLSYN